MSPDHAYLLGRTRTVFDATLKIHREVQKRDLEVGRNLGNWVLRWLDKMKPAAQIRAVGPARIQSASSTTRMPTRQLLEAYRQKTLGGFRYRETGRRLVTSSRNLWHTTYPTVTKLLRRQNPLASNIQYRQLVSNVDSYKLGYGINGVIRDDIMQYLSHA
ncbi:hypothetical protein CTI12_AA441870 [Artemisia annua]|uniref:Uncharacterized protein n=1 Tax=Artemisia annua TaxID=35608 RepID=A0A2U1KZF7_ARTAN|nr:hypothetical protein CTI12_AA441870 [Artemisia annua]